jgi:type I restriction enzyme S subunit
MRAKPLHVPLEAENWSLQPAWARLDDVSDGVFDCPHTTPKLTDSGPFVVRSQDIRGRVFDMQSAGRVSEETYQERIARAEPQYGDLLYSREGTYFGIAAQVPRDQKVCLGQRMVLIRPNQELLDHRFLLYWLNSPVMEAHLLGFRDGSVAERLNMATIRALPVPIIQLHEQREIASILGALDDKIELNRRMSATLEDMARSLYKSWFVDFDPVHAKMEGRQPAFMDEATAALFPDRFGEDGLPEGWTKAKLASIFKSRTERDDGRNIKEFSSSNGGIFPRDQKYNKKLSASGNKNKVAYRGDFVFGLSRKVLNFGLLDQEIGAFSSAYRIYSVDAGYDFSLYVYEYMKLFPDYYYQAVSASSREGQSISEKNLFDLFVPVPIDSIQKAFFEETSAFKKRVVSLVSETNNLVELRDSLLPKLMSGELRVGEAREQVEEVA